ncbi:MAG: hypothetical protein L6R38_006847 [Xanthoria sp. 2 TBL-2021]|nr:MAG: hypothetical protein L6R38_006847 [Xanthoria sp. 2 TBL-2021]
MSKIMEPEIIGNPNNLPIIKATSNFSATAVIDGNPYLPGNAEHPGGFPGWKASNVFYRQIRNLQIDVTNVPANSSVQCIHWPTSQATSLQNIVFHMSQASGNQHQGVFVEDGSGGFMSDLTFNGGQNAAFFGNQQFTVRNFTINNANNAINMAWDWGWTFKSMTINNCSVGLNITNISPSEQTVGSATFIDSNINDTPIGVLTSHVLNTTYTNSSLVLENVKLSNVPIAVQGVGNTTLLSGTGTSGMKSIEGWAQGHSYTPDGPSSISGTIPAFSRPQALLDGDKYYARSKPQYVDQSAEQFTSVRSAGARGDGVTDDYQVLQDLIIRAADTGRIVFIDAGIYKITKTLYIPKESKIVGEAYPVIMSSGSFFANMDSPQPVVQVGQRGEEGCVEWSDTIVATQGAQPGAIAIQWNLVSLEKPSGMWDVHVRIGGFAGSQLQLVDCLATPDVATLTGPINKSCVGAHTSMHVTTGVRGLYLENVWLWTADHDLDDATFTNITVYAGRGLNMQAERNVWLVGTSVEHHSLYQYQLANTRDVFMGQIQSETAYYQPNPDASLPFAPSAELLDPQFSSSCNNGTGQCSGWGLRILDSQDIGIYGAGLYSFFSNYNNSCSFPYQEDCQKGILSIEGSKTQNIGIYNLNTIGASSMIDIDGSSVANASDNVNVFPDTIAVFKLQSEPRAAPSNTPSISTF